MKSYELICADVSTLHRHIAAESVAAAVFSPPYNISAAYPEYRDNIHWHRYEDMATSAARGLSKLLVPGGRVWCNVQPTVPYTQPIRDGKNRQADERRINLAWIWENALRAAGLVYRDIVVWMQDNHDGGTAWGSYRMPSAPNLRGSHELILMFYKPPYKRQAPPKYQGWKDPETLDWPELTRNVWKIAPARNKEHVATFPVELPARAIRLSTWPEEVVLDLFSGSCATGVAALRLGRRFIGVDISERSLEIGERALREAEEEKEAQEAGTTA